MTYAKKVPAMAAVVGFPHPVVRVMVSEERDGLVWCKVADPRLNVRTPLVLDAARVTHLREG